MLDGVFQDEHGDFPVGTCVRNPPEWRHTPGSAQGCTIFVKLWQFDLADRTPVTIPTADMQFDAAPDRVGVEVLPLFEYSRENVSLEKWLPGQTVTLDASGGLEVLVLNGAFGEDGAGFQPQSWFRLPSGTTAEAVAGETGATVWLKRGHLAVLQTAPRDFASQGANCHRFSAPDFF